MQDKVEYLHKAASLPAPHHAWFKYLNEVLIKTYHPTTIQKFVVSNVKKADVDRRTNITGKMSTFVLGD